MESMLIKYILEQCGVKTMTTFQGEYIFYTDTERNLVENDEAMKLVINYLATKVAEKLKAGESFSA